MRPYWKGYLKQCRAATSSTTQFLPGVARGHTAAGSSLMGLG